MVKLRLRMWLTTGAVLSSLSFASAPALAQGKPTTATPAKPAAGSAAKPKGAATKADAADAAKPNLNEAKKAYASGETKYKAGDYAGALADFQAADAIKTTPQSTRYIGLCQDKLGRLQDAVVSYTAFLADVPPKLQAEGESIKKRVDEIKAMPGKVNVVTTPAGASITVDGQGNPQQSPTNLDLPPGKHTLAFRSDGYEAAERSVDVGYASTQDLNVELKELPPAAPVIAPVAATPPPAPAAPPEPAPEPRSLVPAFITGGLAVAAAGVGTAFGIIALGDKSDFDKNPTSSKADDGENHALIADMAFGVAITMGVTSVVLFLTRDEPPPPKAAAGAPPSIKAEKSASVNASKPKSRSFAITPTPIVTAHGGGVGTLIRF